MKRRIYTDTSVIGGCLDDEFRTSSRRLFDVFAAGEDIMVISDLTLLELQLAPAFARDVLKSVPGEYTEEISLTRESYELADSYITAGVIGKGLRADAQHIAIATLHRVDVLVSWNFRHIVNLDRIQGYNSVNLRNGHPMLEIRTPTEVISYEG